MPSLKPLVVVRKLREMKSKKMPDIRPATTREAFISSYFVPLPFDASIRDANIKSGDAQNFYPLVFKMLDVAISLHHLQGEKGIWKSRG